MKVSERLGLNRQIANELNRRFDWTEIQIFLNAFGLKTDISGQWGTDEDYYRSILSAAPLSTLAEIVEDLGLPAFSDAAPLRQMPKIWAEDDKVRVFISHLSKEKTKATRLRDCLANYNMNAFVAHEDIEPTLEWQVQIERALTNCELFVSLHTPEFAKSHWTQQEIGYAVGRGVKIIAVRMGEDPIGFIQKNQALSRGEKTADQLSEEIAKLAAEDERLKVRFLSFSQLELLDDIPF